MTRRRHRLVVALHLLVIAGLVGTLVAAPFVRDFLLRGTVDGPESPLLDWTTGSPMGINTFFDGEPDPAVVERSLDMIQAGGYQYIRQLFSWFEIEPERGSYVTQQGGSSWEKYDRIVEGAHSRGLEIIARLEKPPRWAMEGQPHPNVEGPPDDFADYANYISQVVTRYKGKIRFVQLWNEPNLTGEWGLQPIDPARYVELLKVGAQAARDANEDIVILLAPLAPTDQLGPENLSDLLFLEQVYELGGADNFDIVSVMVYGYGFPPSDRRVSFGRNNFSRPIQTREIMERYGDLQTPIWAVEYGWVSLPSFWAGQPSPWGKPVDEATQASYLLEGYERAQKEWPWMGVMAIWSFRFPERPDAENQIGNPTRGFALVEHDFTPRQGYLTLQEHAAELAAAGTGRYIFDANQQPLTIRGRQLLLQVRGTGQLQIQVDGRAPQSIDVRADQPVEIVVARDLGNEVHTVAVSVSSGDVEVQQYIVAQGGFFDGWYPWVSVAAAAALIGVLASLVWAWRSGPSR